MRLLVVLLAAIAWTTAAEAEEPDVDLRDLRLLAIENGPDGVGAWFEDPRDSSRLLLRAEQPVRGGKILSLSWDEGTALLDLELRREPLHEWRPLPKWRSPFSTLQGEPFGDTSCPLFLETVDTEVARVRIGGPGQSRDVRLGEELCNGWLVTELEPATRQLTGRLTLTRGSRRLKVAAFLP